MENNYHAYSQAGGHAADTSLTQGVGWGLLGGFAATMVMDIALIAGFSAAGLPSLTCFSMVGDTVARFFTILGNAVVSHSATMEIEVAGGVPLGITVHYLIGPAIGASLGVAVAKINALRLDSMKKAVVVSVLYVEILSQPLLAAMPVLLEWSVPQTLEWYGGALCAHLIAGVVLGLVISHGLALGKQSTRPRPLANSDPSVRG